MRKLFAVLVIGAGLAAGTLAADKTELAGMLARGYDALEYWDLPKADEVTVKLQAELPKEADPAARVKIEVYFAEYWFNKGDYAQSLAALDRVVLLGAKREGDYLEFDKRVRRLSEIFSAAKEAQSEHFRMRWIDPRDEVMVKPGLAALEKAWQALSKDLNHSPAGEKVLVELYPKLSDLAAAVGLDEKMLKDSGTIAICKFRRMMLASPRVLLFGYDYQTTMSHELAHFFVYTKSGPDVPVWFQEGLAKFEDQSYKAAAGQLDPVAKSFLTSAVKNNELITFAQMHPTFAQFKTPKQGQLAFAEVETMVDYLRKSCGGDAWFRLLDLMEAGKDDKAAVEEVCGREFGSVWAGWKLDVLARNWQVIPNAVVMKLEFKEQTGGEDEYEEVPVDKGKAYEYLRLGDLLRDRGFYGPACFEYQKAAALEPYVPMVLNKLGLGRVLAGNFKAALEPLNKVTQTYPGYSTGFVNLGLAYEGLKDDAQAIAAFERASELNPFNPAPYVKLFAIHERRGDQQKLDQVKEAFNIINRRPGG